MKRICILVFTALFLLGTLCACSASGRINDPFYPDGYSNVSTTHDGTVNGVNDRRAPAPSVFESGRSRAPQRTVTGGDSAVAPSGGYNGTTSGTGMVGGE